MANYRIGPRSGLMRQQREQVAGPISLDGWLSSAAGAHNGMAQ